MGRIRWGRDAPRLDPSPHSRDCVVEFNAGDDHEVRGHHPHAHDGGGDGRAGRLAVRRDLACDGEPAVGGVPAYLPVVEPAGELRQRVGEVAHLRHELGAIGGAERRGPPGEHEAAAAEQVEMACVLLLLHDRIQT